MKLLIISLLLLPAIVFAGGLFNEATTPVAGSVVEYIRWPFISVTNQYGQSPEIEFTSEKVKLYPDGNVLKTFNRRTRLKMSDYAGKKLPLYNPDTGEQIGTYTPEQYYAMTYSMSILSENAADSACYTTNGEIRCSK